jgi:hypothetical protein
MKRTPKLTIIFRLALIPLLVTAFWGLMLSIADASLGFYLMIGGLVALVLESSRETGRFIRTRSRR